MITRHRMKGPGCFFLCVLLAAFAMVSKVHAQGIVQFSDGHRHFQFSSDKLAAPIIEYTLIHYMLAVQDPQPLMRVYGDGRVHVHIPVYMKRHGDYELTMTAPELETLLSSLAQDGIIDFDSDAVRQQKRQVESQLRATDGSLSYVSDITETVITVKLDGYQSSPGSQRLVNLNRRFTWQSLEHDAKRYWQVGAIQGAAAGAKRLHGFISHPGLNKLP